MLTIRPVALAVLQLGAISAFLLQPFGVGTLRSVPERAQQWRDAARLGRICLTTFVILEAAFWIAKRWWKPKTKPAVDH